MNSSMHFGNKSANVTLFKFVSGCGWWYLEIGSVIYTHCK